MDIFHQVAWLIERHHYIPRVVEICAGWYVFSTDEDYIFLFIFDYELTSSQSHVVWIILRKCCDWLWLTTALQYLIILANPSSLVAASIATSSMATSNEEPSSIS